MIKKSCLAILAVSLLFPVSALAGAYIGASIGNTWVDDEITVDEATNQIKSISENSTGWKLFLGFQGDGFFGVEGGYRDLGKVEFDDGEHAISASTSGWDIAALGHLDVSVLDLFAKAGGFFWDSDSTLNTLSGGDSGTAFIWGLGVGVSLGPIGVRLEWESMEDDKIDSLSMMTLGATLGF